MAKAGSDIEQGSGASAAAIVASVKEFAGCFYVWKWSAHGLRRKAGGKPLPHYRHSSIDSAFKEAQRLATIWPDSTFVIIQEVGRVKLPKPAALVSAEAGNG
jgi:hypothetical protein